MAQRIKILIACHRQYPGPDGPCDLPVEVGAALHTEPIPGFTPDNTGENISEKNKNYCELTALFWAWKNLDADAVGFVHYRRFFAGRPFSKQPAQEADFRKALDRAPILLPVKRHYWIETNYSQYIHAHHTQDLEITRAVLAERCPEYLSAYDRQMQKRSGHRFNMFVMRRDCFDAWCAWLFPVLFEVERRLDISGYDPYNARVFGFVAERLLDVWIETNGYDYRELPVLNTENQHWIRKGTAFIKRKFTYKSHEK